MTTPKLTFTRAEGIPDVLIIDPAVFGDARGWFIESYSARLYAEHGLDATFVQDNMSRSPKGVLRGLHMQSPPSSQGKLVSVVVGEVYDVAVDVRIGSPSYGKFVGLTLSAENKRQMYIPPGFAHGFCVTSDEAIFAYKCTQYYDPKSDLSIAYNDPAFGIPWPIKEPVLSKKDAEAKRLAEIAPERLMRFGGGK